MTLNNEIADQEAASSPPPNAAAGWAGWMTTGMSSLTSKLYTNKQNPSAQNTGVCRDTRWMSCCNVE